MPWSRGFPRPVSNVIEDTYEMTYRQTTTVMEVVDFCLPYACVFDYRAGDQADQMIFKRTIVLFIGIIIGTMAVRGNVPIIVETGTGKRAVMKLCSDASDQLRNGDVANASFRNGQQAVKDARAACSIMQWKDEDMIDTLAAAYAETGDFESAARYAAQALAVKGISAQDAKVFREHLALFQQRKRIPVSQ